MKQFTFSYLRQLFLLVAAFCSYSVSFGQYTVTWSEDIDGGSLSVVYKDNESTVVENGVTEVPAGTWLKVINTPDSGKELTSLKVETDLGVVDLSAPYEFELTDNVELIAEFGDETPKDPVLSWTVGGNMGSWATTTITVGEDTPITYPEPPSEQKDSKTVKPGTVVTVATSVAEGGLKNGVAPTVKVNGVEQKLDIEGKCSFTVNEDTELTVMYTVKEYNVTFNKTPADKGEVLYEDEKGPTGYQRIKANTEFKVIATPVTGWKVKFVRVTIGGVVATPVDGKYKATGDVVIDVEFVEEGAEITYNVTVEKPENGNLAVTYTDADGAEQTVDTSAFGADETEKSFTVEPESVLKVTVTPANGYELDVLSPVMTEKTDGDKTYYEYTVNADVTVSATFKQFGSLTLEGFEESEGTVVVEASVGDEWKAVDLARIAVGTELRLTVKAAENYEVVSVMNGDTEIVKDADGYYYFTLETAAATLTVTFKPVACKVTVTGFEAAEGSVLVEAENEGAWAEVEDLENVAFGTELRLTVTAAEKYEVESVKKGSEAIAKGTDGFYLLTVDAKEVTVTVTFKQLTSIDKVSAAGVYYNEEVLYTAGAASVKVYDLTGSVVLSAENVEALNVSELPAGVYVAVVDGVTVKFCK